MKLTTKDKEFLSVLRELSASGQLRIVLENDGFKRFVLKQNYGSYIEERFTVTRQGVRWRFNRLFNEVYVSAYTAIVLIESAFGAELRSHALTIAKQRIELHEKAKKMGITQVPRRQRDDSVVRKRRRELARESPS